MKKFIAALRERIKQMDRRAFLIRTGMIILCAALLIGLVYLAFGQAVDDFDHFAVRNPGYHRQFYDRFSGLVVNSGIDEALASPVIHSRHGQKQPGFHAAVDNDRRVHAVQHIRRAVQTQLDGVLAVSAGILPDGRYFLDHRGEAPVRQRIHKDVRFLPGLVIRDVQFVHIHGDGHAGIRDDGQHGRLLQQGGFFVLLFPGAADIHHETAEIQVAKIKVAAVALPRQKLSNKLHQTIQVNMPRLA